MTHDRSSMTDHNIGRMARRVRVLAALFCVWLPLVAAGPIEDPLLLVVGDVTTSSARILYDQVPVSASSLRLRVQASSVRIKGVIVDNEADQTLELSLSSEKKQDGRPQVVELKDLRPGQRYVAQFIVDELEHIATVIFHTARPMDAMDSGEAHSDRVLVVSCDRFVDDHDDVMMEKLASDVEAHDDATGSPSVHFGMAHLGDQIYADAGALSIKVVPMPLKDMDNPKLRRARYNSILAQFRGIYRKTFGRKAAQRVFRVGAHWMLPDDHEIINNFNIELVQKAFVASQDPAVEEAERERLVALQLHCRAGLQAYYEFQYQLCREFPWEAVDFLEDPLGDIVRAYPVYFSVELQQMKMLFTDLRFERSFFDAANEKDIAKLVSDKQRKFLDDKLEVWSKEAGNAAVVFASMPLFFQSAFSAAIAHTVEHEMYPGMASQRSGLEDLFHMLQKYKQPKSAGSYVPLLRLLVGGDLHMMAHSRVCGAAEVNAGCVDQLITSGITNGSTAIQDTKLIPYYFLITHLTPLFETVYSWAQCIPLLSALLPRSSPWYIEYDRVFLGRNYGVLELSDSGEFVWDQTVIAPYDTDSQRRVQSILDALSPSILSALAVLITLVNTIVAHRLYVQCHTTRKPTHVTKTVKTQ